MSTPDDDHIYQEAQLAPMTVAEINELTRAARAQPPSADQTHVLVPDGEDPWVISHEGQLYYCTVDRLKRKILVAKFSRLQDMAAAELVEVWPGLQGATPEFVEIWAPELQLIDGQWYVYFALYNARLGEERLYALQGISADPQGEYEFKGKLAVPTDRWAIDGTVLRLDDEQLYFLWSGWEGATNVSQNLYIARMSNPWTISSDRVCISRPEHDWEKQGYPYVNEGPQVLQRQGRTFVIYSASGSWTDDYCLGQLTYLGGDPLSPAAWRKEPRPVFAKTSTIFGPGHASFVELGGQDYIIYHAARRSRAGWARQIRYKPFTWHEDGSPDFGEPL
ncbi:glycoside hydrolase family 43 protein [Hymenobacter chitinivorans]|uniref:GH43 family beta-xylosidase n=1 Tax=Hymenobacter chitinivorans DSM 11115 TaxID=1121954 RepID=A0A2M9BQ19_9BACT|nr:glycoside hydrolase family 43 protein [Hymenobacter chitinivorans]PJJ60041.1 GH43 family beta-xylosidase [Hymenobacter chitinivorans DSM 11115]